MKEQKEFYVYEWFVIDTGEVFYVGKGKNNRCKNISGRNKFFKDMYETHNCNVRKIYENLTEQEAFEKEIETIKFYRENTNYRLTNQTDGGEGSVGWKATEEFKKKQSIIHKKQWQDENFRQKILEIRKDENGIYKSKEFRDKISSLVKGENNPNFKNYWSDEQKENLSRKQKNNPLYKNESNPNAKKIICIETGEIFNCIKFAIEKYNIKSDGSMTVALKNPIRTAGHLHWVIYSEEFLDDIYRFNYLIEVLKMSTTQSPIICIDNLNLYNSKTNLAKELNVTVSKIDWYLKKDGKFEHQNKTYILLKYF